MTAVFFPFNSFVYGNCDNITFWRYWFRGASSIIEYAGQAYIHFCYFGTDMIRQRDLQRNIYSLQFIILL